MSDLLLVLGTLLYGTLCSYIARRAYLWQRAERRRTELECQHVARMLAEHDAVVERLAQQLTEQGANLLAKERRGKAA